MEGRLDEALVGWRAAIAIDPECLMARLNRDLIEAELSFGQESGDLDELKLAPAPVPSPLVGAGGAPIGADLRVAGAVGARPLTRPTGTLFANGARGTAGRVCRALLAHPPWPPLHKGGKAMWLVRTRGKAMWLVRTRAKAVWVGAVIVPRADPFASGFRGHHTALAVRGGVSV